jgi:hypothetical protein
MPTTTFKTNQQRRVPVKRNRLFYDREQFMFDMELGREYVEGDLGQTVVLYQVDLSKSSLDDLYMETDANGIAYKAPVEIPCTFNIEDAELKAYDKTKNLGTYLKQGKLKVGVYNQTLIDYGVDIKIGDFLGVQVDETHMVYYQVENDGRASYANKYTQFGTVPLYRSIVASWVDPSTFNG